MFLKAIGTGFLLISCSGYGFYLRNRFRKRILMIEKLCHYIEDLKGEIKYRNQDLYYVFARLERNREQKLLGNEICREMKKGKTVSEAWCCSVRENAPRLCLKTKEEQLLCDLGEELGKSNRETQVNLLTLYQDRLLRLWEELKNAEGSQCKIYTSFGILGGIMISLILV